MPYPITNGVLAMSEITTKSTEAADIIAGNAPSAEVVPKNILIPFILLTSCFALWGLANNMTDVLIALLPKKET